jgi:hypothetical protein
MNTKAFQPPQTVCLPQIKAAMPACGCPDSWNGGKTIPLTPRNLPPQRIEIQNLPQRLIDGGLNLPANGLASGQSRTVRVWEISR